MRKPFKITNSSRMSAMKQNKHCEFICENRMVCGYVLRFFYTLIIKFLSRCYCLFLRTIWLNGNNILLRAS